MTSTSTSDVIDQLSGIAPGHPLDAIRAGRAQARIHSQQSYLALFEPALPVAGDFTLVERFAVATFVTGVQGQAQASRFYAAGLARQGAARQVIDALAVEAATGTATGPFGRFPEGPLTKEDAPGPYWRVSDSGSAILGARLSAALAHAHLLVFHPRDAGAQDLQALLDSGWSPTDIVTLSQLVAFLAFQVRVVAGLQALAS
ncbi:CMD domain protein [Variovorax sp. J22R24]|uniref:CMD domain protein n=1 Tax=Variovorax gracilis TaxID=3053502 RepID=UPI0025779F83|nr:CMD domain protein [Variovorax sp. J22R24]MDM0104617.1 CMD domain protein [Variovorax sp. J22R24]